MFNFYYIVIFSTLLMIHNVDSINLLFLNGVGSPSHNLWNHVLIEGLAANEKYNITIVTPDLINTTYSNMHYIHLEKTYSVMYSDDSPLDIIALANEKPISNIQGLTAFSVANCKGVLASEGLDAILNYPNDFKFDAIFHDFLCGPCLIPLLHKFNYPPLIAISALNAPSFKNDLIGGHRYPSYVPYFSTGLHNQMNFMERVYSHFLYQWEYLYRNFIYKPRIAKMIHEKYHNLKNLPSHQELESKAVLMILNSNFAFDYSEPIQPNVVNAGGLQIKDPKPLPEDLNDFIEKGKKGTVVMSLGTNMRSDLLEKETLLNIITTFKEIPEYNFIWKFESDQLPMEKPPNVKIVKFLKQNDILAHPKIKLFISHCGLMSTQEAIWYGKPIVGIPLFGDQRRNVRQMMELGAAERTFLQILTKEDFKEKILKVLNNPIYKDNAQKLSKRFRDQPEKPLDRAIWWVEYILRNPNPDHLLSPTIKLGLFASEGYDVLLFEAIIILITLYSIYKLTKKLFERLFLKTLPKLIKLD